MCALLCPVHVFFSFDSFLFQVTRYVCYAVLVGVMLYAFGTRTVCRDLPLKIFLEIEKTKPRLLTYIFHFLWRPIICYQFVSFERIICIFNRQCILPLLFKLLLQIHTNLRWVKLQFLPVTSILVFYLYFFSWVYFRKAFIQEKKSYKILFSLIKNCDRIPVDVFC